MTTPQDNPRPTFLPFFIFPGVLVGAAFVLALLSILQFAVRSFIPGKLDVGGFTLDNYASIAKPMYVASFGNTVFLSAATAVTVLFVAYPVAYQLVRTRSRALRTLLLVLAMLPLFLGEVVRTYAWTVVLGSRGVINTMLLQLGVIDTPVQLMFTRLGIIIAMVHFTFPIMVMVLTTGIAYIDRKIELAAGCLGASPFSAFVSVTLPMSWPAIAGGVVTCFAWCFSAFATPQLIGGGRVSTVSTLVFDVGFSSSNFPVAAALSSAGVLLTALLLVSIIQLGHGLRALRARRGREVA